jgi:hypothetical protein
MDQQLVNEQSRLIVALKRCATKLLSLANTVSYCSANENESWGLSIRASQLKRRLHWINSFGPAGLLLVRRILVCSSKPGDRQHPITAVINTAKTVTSGSEAADPFIFNPFATKKKVTSETSVFLSSEDLVEKNRHPWYTSMPVERFPAELNPELGKEKCVIVEAQTVWLDVVLANPFVCDIKIDGLSIIMDDNILEPIDADILSSGFILPADSYHTITLPFRTQKDGSFRILGCVLAMSHGWLEDFRCDSTGFCHYVSRPQIIEEVQQSKQYDGIQITVLSSQPLLKVSQCSLLKGGSITLLEGECTQMHIILENVGHSDAEFLRVHCSEEMTVIEEAYSLEDVYEYERLKCGTPALKWHPDRTKFVSQQTEQDMGLPESTDGFFLVRIPSRNSVELNFSVLGKLGCIRGCLELVCCGQDTFLADMLSGIFLIQ